MNPIDAFLVLLRSWRNCSGFAFDDDEVSAPHAAVTAFDLEGFGSVARSLRADAASVGETLSLLESVQTDLPQSWTGAGADALAVASATLSGQLAPAAADLGTQARTATAAHEILGEVIADYRAVMAGAAQPLAAGIGPAEAREELSARLDLVRAAGLAASRAVDDGIGALHDDWRSPGELVLAGDR
ncbi:hypothetical protein C6V83_06450 [Gordonia iterans]|uniref:ESX-1 secretion-associated protein EspA/EspE-like domain-containing protein n=1 Tax=Gordonia iterans TaxID=1004901 RepID=A0A2S0KE67_9ACTN|nr:hypothetical protein [Gordonia iterans]AVL99964.1 hypothetical protein C6V83_06450 [Gordonia iterans]